MFGPKEMKVTGGWRKLGNEQELRNLHSSQILGRIDGGCTYMAEMINSYKILVGSPEGKREVE
jgi:hypothetical protein